MAEIVIVTAIENLEIVTDHAAAHHPGAEIAVRVDSNSLAVSSQLRLQLSKRCPTGHRKMCLYLNIE